MEIELAKSYFIGMMVLPVVLSCATLDDETHANHNEHPKKVVEKPVPAPVNTSYGKLVKISSSADALFDFDSAALKPSSVQSLENFARELQDVQNNLMVIGHTDRIGSDHYNKNLSLHRAETVKIYLISKGTDPSRISTYGKGESNPITGDNCEESMEREALIDCLSPDRRVEVKVADIQ